MQYYHLKIQIHTCPEFLNFDAIRPATACGIFAELNTINGAFPPSSKETFLTVDTEFSSKI